MDGSAPKELLQHVDQHTTDLHQAVAVESTRAGHSVTVEQVNPEDSSPLSVMKEALGNAAVHIVGTTGIIMEGTGPNTYVEAGRSNKGISIAAGRERLKKAA